MKPFARYCNDTFGKEWSPRSHHRYLTITACFFRPLESGFSVSAFVSPTWNSIKPVPFDKYNERFMKCIEKQVLNSQTAFQGIDAVLFWSAPQAERSRKYCMTISCNRTSLTASS